MENVLVNRKGQTRVIKTLTCVPSTSKHFSSTNVLFQVTPFTSPRLGPLI